MMSKPVIIAALWFISIYYVVQGMNDSHKAELNKIRMEAQKVMTVNNQMIRENKKIQERNQRLDKAYQELTSKYNKLKTKYGLTDDQPVNTNKSGLYYEVFKE